LTAKVRYQTCNDKTCKIPKNKTATFIFDGSQSATHAAAFAFRRDYTQAKLGPTPASIRRGCGRSGGAMPRRRSLTLSDRSC